MQLSTSGVGVQSRYLINGLINTGKYTFRCLGAALKHESLETIKVNDDFIIKPIDGFGDQNLLRSLLATEKPDVLLLFTDPRFFTHAFLMEDEIHQVCPIAYNHLWDEEPWPEFNRVIYESTDLINCINWPTYEMVHARFPDRTHYVPHAVPKEIFSPLSAIERTNLRTTFLGKERADHFIALFVARNARRKVPSDIIAAFKLFLQRLEAGHGHRKASLVMHCDPMDQEGTNLHHVIDMLHMKDHVIFSKDRIDFSQMNSLYNMCDVLVNASCNEGFGIPVLEMKMCGNPVIAIKTGGLTRQVIDHETGEEFGAAMEPDVRSLVGTHSVPYINECFVSHETISRAFMKVHDTPVAERQRIGVRARSHALKNYSMDHLIKTWDATLSQLVDDWKQRKLPNNKRWEMFEV